MKISCDAVIEELNQDVLRLTNQYIETRMELASERERVDELLGSPRTKRESAGRFVSDLKERVELLSQNLRIAEQVFELKCYNKL